MSAMHLVKHESIEVMADRVAEEIAAICRDALADRGAASLVLAGGSTPLPVYRRLATEALDWNSVQLLPGDDRWVAIDDEASNRKALAECFGTTDAGILPLVPEQPGDAPELDTARQSLARVAGDFDACVLGMGTDGHFASLFPGVDGLSRALDPDATEDVVTIRPDPLPPEAPYPRISLTLHRLLASRHRLLLVRGEEKRSVLERALDGADLPIAALLKHAGPRLDIHWSP